MNQKQIYVPDKIVYTHSGKTDVFICKEQIGHGGFAFVYHAKHQISNKSYAIKIISKNNYLDSDNKEIFAQLKNEIEIQINLNHPNIVKLYASFSDEYNYYIILEYCQGKSIRDFLKKNGKMHLNEEETIKILSDIIHGLVYLHNQKVIHHDLKLENFLIGSDGRIKIADFGVSTVLKNFNDKSYSVCGTTNYMSPELLQDENEGHSFEVDVWAIGVSAFMLLTGQYPFGGFEKDFVLSKIKNCEYSFPSNVQISNDAQNFIKSIFSFDPRNRPTAKELLNFPLLLKYDQEKTRLYETSIGVPTICKLSSSKYDISDLENYSNNNSIENLNKNKKLINSTFSYQSIRSFTYNKYESILPHENECGNVEYNQFESSKQKTYIIPNHFVTKFTLYYEDLGFILGNGTVGICFDDCSRIVLDPNEKFIQYYDNYNSKYVVIKLEQLDENLNGQIAKPIQIKIKLVKKFAKNFKKYLHLYKLNDCNYDPVVPLYHVKKFVKKNNSILFKLNDNNVQMNFADSQKLIIFKNMKKICIMKYFNEKCNLLNIDDVLIMNQNRNEYQKYQKAEELLSTIL